MGHDPDRKKKGLLYVGPLVGTILYTVAPTNRILEEVGLSRPHK